MENALVVLVNGLIVLLSGVVTQTVLIAGAVAVVVMTRYETAHHYEIVRGTPTERDEEML